MARSNMNYDRAYTPRFSLNRTLVDLISGGISAIQRDAVQASGGALDSPHKVEIPWRCFASARDLVSGTASAGGYLVGATTYGAAEALAPLSALMACGVRTVNNPSNGVIPRIVASATAEWVVENEASTASTPTVGMAAVTAHWASTHVRFSRLLDLQSADVERVLRLDLLAVVAALVDGGLIGGDGNDGTPYGFVNAAGNTESGSSLAWADIQAMLGHVRTAGGLDPFIHWITTPAIAELLGQRECASGNAGFILANGAIAGRPCHISVNCPTGYLIALDNRALTAAFFGGVGLEVNPYGNDASDFRGGIKQARVMLACDVAVTNPNAICTASSVT